MRGWLTAPVVGDGGDFPLDKDGKEIVTPDRGLFRAAVSDREGVDRDRLEFVIDPAKAMWCLVAYDVADPSNFSEFGGEELMREDELDVAVGLVSGASKLDALAVESGVEKTGSARKVLRGIGETIIPRFDERRHLSSGTMPSAGSFVKDTFTDKDGTKLTDHTGETGAKWTMHESPDNATIVNNMLPKSSGSPAWYTASGLPAGPNYDVLGELYIEALIYSTRICGRCQEAEKKNFYQARRSSGTRWRLSRYVENSVTELAIYDEAVELEETVPFTLSFRDDGIRMYARGEEIGFSADETFAEGLVGVDARGSGGEQPLDSISATDFGVVVAAPPASATTSALVPTVSVGVTVQAEAASSAASAPTPTLSIGVTVEAEAASSTASAPAPALSIAVAIQAEAASSVASAPAPTLSLGVTVEAEVASATASAPAPTVGITQVVVVPVASSTASAPTPTLSITVAVEPEAASATASAPAPAISVTGKVEAEVASSVASALVPILNQEEGVTVEVMVGGEFTAGSRYVRVSGEWVAA